MQIGQDRNTFLYLFSNSHGASIYVMEFFLIWVQCYVFGEPLQEKNMININYALSQQLGRALESRGLTLTLAESCTGGGTAEEITAVDGCSAWFDRGFVTYSNDAKIELLGVKSKTIQQFGAVSPEVAKEMAMGALNHSHADISLSITGIAGPSGGTPEKPVGLVWFSIANKRTGSCQARMQQFTGGRKNVRVQSIQYGLSWLIRTLNIARSL